MFKFLQCLLLIGIFGNALGDDNYELNNTLATAYDLSSSQDTWLDTIDGLGIQSDDDWYQIEVTPGNRRVLVDLRFTHSEGNIDVKLVDPAGSVLVASDSASDNESIDFIVPSAGTYFILIYLGNAGNSYNLWWNELPPPPDNYEPNNTLATAYDLSSEEQTWLDTIDGLGIQSDDDWYQIEVTPGDRRVLVDLQFVHSEGDIDLQLINASGSPLVRAETESDNESIDFTVPSAGTYYIRVYYSDAANDYNLWWDDQPPLPDDNYEPNNTLATAYDLSSEEQTWLDTIDGLGIQSDDDWYQIEVQTGSERVHADLQFLHSEGDIDMSLVNSAGGVLASSESESDNELINFIVPSAGTYYIRVYFGDEGNTYNLLWDDRPQVTEDNYEPNNTLATAYDLSNNEQTWLDTIDGPGIQFDDDWYQITVTPGERRVLLDLQFIHSEGDIDVSLVDSAGDVLALSESESDNEYMDFTVPNAGTYYIRVYFGNVGNAYNLWWDDTVPTQTCNSNIVSAVTETSDVSHEACEILSLGPDFIAADGANVSANSGWEIDFLPGFTVEQGATLEANVCGQSLCLISSSPMPYGCHSCVDQICAIDASCCALEFDSTCLDMVATVCELVCE